MPATEAPPAPEPRFCPATDASRILPEAGALLGVSLDWADVTVEQYTERLGRSPAVAVGFTPFPLTAEGVQNLNGAADQLRPSGGVLLLTLEPTAGLAAVTPAAAEELAVQLAAVNASGVPVVVRFAHEMNGSWYPWSQQPEAYIAAFRSVADAVHAGAPGSAMMWAPNYGGGYPFAGGRYQAHAGQTGFGLLDTDRDGAVTGLDDPYAPYYPGDDAVDWVGMSLYHWGSDHPWGENELPEDGKLASQLTGEYSGLGGDDTAVPDFYAEYAVGHGKPLAIPETAAFYRSDAGGADGLAIKRAWWRQALAAATLESFPMLRMVNWFEWTKFEPEVGGEVDWTVTSDPAVHDAFVSELPAGMLGAESLPDWCAGSQD
jgi:hypothetical protein